MNRFKLTRSLAYLFGGLTVHILHVVQHSHDDKNYLRTQSEDANDRCSSARKFYDAFEPMKTDKIFRHGYHWFYGPKFSEYKSKPGLRILEIGARSGNSAAGWTKYFDDAYVDMMTYGGAENDLTWEPLECKLGDCSKIERFEGDQSDTDFLDTVMKQRSDGWDIIVDDASHVPAHNIITFEHLWKNLKPGGLYVIEDVETSYYTEGEVYKYKFEAGMLAPPQQNVLKRFQQYADVINRGYFPKDVSDYSLFEGDHDIEEIGYARNIVYIRKANSCCQFGESDVVNCCQIDGNDVLNYPKEPANLPGKSSISASVIAAKKMFEEGSKYLDQWRTAPSFQKNLDDSPMHYYNGINDDLEDDNHYYYDGRTSHTVGQTPTDANINMHSSVSIQSPGMASDNYSRGFGGANEELQPGMSNFDSSTRGVQDNPLANMDQVRTDSNNLQAPEKVQATVIQTNDNFGEFANVNEQKQSGMRAFDTAPGIRKDAPIPRAGQIPLARNGMQEPKSMQFSNILSVNDFGGVSVSAKQLQSNKIKAPDSVQSKIITSENAHHGYRRMKYQSTKTKPRKNLHL